MAHPGPDLFFKTISQLNQMLVSREISAQDLAKAYLDRLKKLGPRYNALALLLEHQAIKQAKQVNGDLKRIPALADKTGLLFAINRNHAPVRPKIAARMPIPP